MSALLEKFAQTKRAGRAALIGYLPAGFPTPADSVRIISAMVAGGVDIVEVGLPYSDPLMDGPTIQEAAQTALAAGTTTDVVLEVVGSVAQTGAPTLVMSYWNPIEQYGIERFTAALADHGGVGVITPDLTVDEAGEWIAATDSHGIDRVFLAAPASTDERLAKVCSAANGFVYAASVMGVTGTRTSVSSAASELVSRLRPLTDQPIAVGLGVSTAEQVAQVAQYADGVIVGSAFVRSVLAAPSTDAAVAAAGSLAAELAVGLGRPES